MRVDVVAVVRDEGVRGLAPINVGDFWGLVLMGAQFIMCVECGEVWGGRVSGFGGGYPDFGGFILVVATHWGVGGWGLGGEAGIQLVWSSIAQWRGLANPIFEGAVVTNGDFRYIGKKKTEIFHNIVFVVMEWASYLSNIVTSCSQHLLGRTVMLSLHGFPKKIK